MQLFFLLEAVFSIWMLFDCMQRRPGALWFLVILLPFGEWVYFFMVYSQDDPQMRRLVKKAASSTRRESLSDLESAVAALPSVNNKVRLAQGLHDAGRYSDAVELFRAVLARDDDNKEALFGLALSCKSAQDDAGALEALEKLAEIDIAYRDFAPGAELAAILWHRDRKDEALAKMKTVSRRSQRFEHEVQYAMFLIETGSKDEARALLEEGLAQYRTGPAFNQKADAVWAKRAKALIGLC